MPSYQDAIRTVAGHRAIPLIDLPAQMERGAVRPAEMLAVDGVHLSIPGNRLYAAMVCDGLTAKDADAGALPRAWTHLHDRAGGIERKG